MTTSSFLPLATTVLGAAIALCGTWITARRNTQIADATRFLEARRPFFQKQLDFCIEATAAAARIVSTDDEAEFDAARRSFWELYWGRLALVEDDKLACAMARFGHTLDPASIPKRRRPDPLPPAIGFSDDRSELRDLSIDIADAAKALIASNWVLVDGRGASIDPTGTDPATRGLSVLAWFLPPSAGRRPQS